jgi:hypothetical protein
MTFKIKIVDMTPVPVPVVVSRPAWQEFLEY